MDFSGMSLSSWAVFRRGSTEIGDKRGPFSKARTLSAKAISVALLSYALLLRVRLLCWALWAENVRISIVLDCKNYGFYLPDYTHIISKATYLRAQRGSRSVLCRMSSDLCFFSKETKSNPSSTRWAFWGVLVKLTLIWNRMTSHTRSCSIKSESSTSWT